MTELTRGRANLPAIVLGMHKRKFRTVQDHHIEQVGQHGQIGVLRHLGERSGDFPDMPRGFLRRFRLTVDHRRPRESTDYTPVENDSNTTPHIQTRAIGYRRGVLVSPWGIAARVVPKPKGVAV